jgi:DNA sulfur modification protein DndC
MGCPLVQEDAALERVIANPKWAYLAPLRQLRPLYWEVKKPQYRLRKHGELRKDGTLAKKQGRLGPLTLETRRWMLGEVLRIEAEVNGAAAASGQPPLSLINDQELARIEALLAANTWPEKWDGTEHRGDEWLPEILADGSVQPLLFGKLPQGQSGSQGRFGA